MDINSLSCRSVLYYFEEINKIPRGSGNEKQISDYLYSFAKDRNLWVHQDSANNIVIKKPASEGYENAPTIAIQGHMDMVCEKNNYVEHNFLTDPIKVIYENGFMRAEGTTLGADDGIAVAMAMALLDSDEILHPAIEVVITTDEEVGMCGAASLDTALLESRILINIDSEEEGIFTVGCAGGRKVTTTIPVVYEQNTLPCYKISLKGLKGGHSGIDIIKERANANKLMARALSSLTEKLDYKLAYIDGGAKDNAIPREAEAIICTAEAFEKIVSFIKELEQVFKKEFSIQESSLSFDISEVECYNQAFSSETTQNVISFLMLVPNGVCSMNTQLNMAESSNNIGVVKTTENGVKCTCAVRSSVVSRKELIYSQLCYLTDLVNGKIEYRGDYPAWEYEQTSFIRDVFKEKFIEEFNVEPAVETVHAGLECGIFAEKIKGMDMISFGPNLYDIHTPDEKAEIMSVERMWKLLLKVLKSIKE